MESRPSSSPDGGGDVVLVEGCAPAGALPPAVRAPVQSTSSGEGAGEPEVGDSRRELRVREWGRLAGHALGVEEGAPEVVVDFWAIGARSGGASGCQLSAALTAHALPRVDQMNA